MRPPPLYAAVVAATAVVAVIAIGWWLQQGTVTYARVGVAWAATIPSETREQIARSLSLMEVRRDDDVWFYMLADPSASNIAALVARPEIVGTSGIDQSSRTPTDWATTSALRWLEMRYPVIETRAGVRLSRLVRPVAVLPVAAAAWIVALLARGRGRAWLAGRVAPMTPASMGVFRIVLTLAWLPVAVHDARADASWRGVALLLLPCLFGLGILPRLSLLAISALYLDSGSHPMSQPIKTLAALAVVPWGEGAGIGESVRRWRGRATSPRARRRYGLATWIPMTMLGSAYAAGAFAKLDERGLGWITEGGVRYFFVVDGPQAPTELGLVIASSDAWSVAAAGVAWLTEATVIVAALWPNPVVALVAGVGALGLHLGFWLFQGVWWPAWWALLPAFWPWHGVTSWLQARLPNVAIVGHADCAGCARTTRWIHALDWFDRVSFSLVDAPPDGAARHRLSTHLQVRVERGERPTAKAPAGGPGAAIGRPVRLATAVTWTVLGFLIVQQPLVSLLRVETPLVFSDFAMYSDWPWSSKDDFAAFMERTRAPSTPAVALEPILADGSRLADRLTVIDPTGELLRAATRLVATGSLDEATISGVRRVDDANRQRYGAPLLPLRVRTADWRFDWSVARVVPAGVWRDAGVLALEAPPAPAP